MEDNGTPIEVISSQSEETDIDKAYSVLLSYAYHEYRHLAIERQSIQLTYIKTYITLASIIIGAVISSAVFLKIAEGEIPFPKTWPEAFCLFCVGISLLAALAVFIVAVDLLRGRGVRWIPFAEIKRSYEWVKGNKSLFTKEHQTELLESLISSVAEGLKISGNSVERISKKLRWFSIGLTVAIIFGLIGIAIRIFFIQNHPIA